MKPYKKRSPGAHKKKPTSYEVETPDTLLASLLTNLPNKKRKLLKAVLRDRQVRIDGETVTQFDHPLKPGQRVEVFWERVLQEKHPRELNIVFLDEDLIVMNKPSGLLTIATDKENQRTAYSMVHKYIKTENPENKLFVVHRLDRDTSGLLLFARSEQAKRAIQETWKTTIAERTYVGVVEGRVEAAEATVTSWLTESKALVTYSSQRPEGGKKAVTHYRKITGNERFTLLKFNLETTVKHQIRVHMQDIKHPIVGDKKYGSTTSPIKRMGLHAQVLAFIHPTTGEECRFDTGIPHQFMKLCTLKK